MILLEKLLSGLDVEVSRFTMCRLDLDGRVDLRSAPAASVHCLLKGSADLEIGGRNPLRAESPSVIVIPSSLATRIRARSPGVLLACGDVDATYREAHGLFEYLDTPLVERFDDGDPVGGALATLNTELNNPEAGSDHLCGAALNQCLIYLLRRYCEGGECRLPWLEALEDPRLGRALETMLDGPDEPHSLESLAAISGMSRSAFAAAFQAAFDRTPMDFLKEIRLRRAARLLVSTDLPIKSIAGRVGYRSRSRFSAAFQSKYGESPSGFRLRTDPVETV